MQNIGKKAMEFSNLSDEDLIAKAMTALKTMFPGAT